MNFVILYSKGIKQTSHVDNVVNIVRKYPRDKGIRKFLMKWTMMLVPPDRCLRELYVISRRGDEM